MAEQKNNVTDEQLAQTLRQGKGGRLGGRLLSLVGVVVAIAGIILGGNIVVILIGGVILALGQTVQGKSKGKADRQAFEAIVPGVAGSVLEDVQLEPGQHILRPGDTNIPVPTHTDSRGDGYVRGTYKGLTVELCAVRMTDVDEVQREETGLWERNEREVYAGQLSEITGIGKSALLQEIQRVRDIRLRTAKKKQTRREMIPVNQIQPKNRQLRYENPRSARAEEGILRLLMLDGSLVSQTQGLEPSQFSSPVLGKIYGILLGHLSQGRSLQLGALEGELEGEEITLLAHILGQPVAMEHSAAAMIDYRAVIEREAMRRQNTNDEAVLLAARDTYRKKKSISQGDG